MSDDRPRLIEAAFPLKQASLDSVHEKNVRHGHISTLHIWPARRPLAACRAALIATLLPDPGNPQERQRLLERIGGTVRKRIERKKVGGKVVEVEREETVGGVLHWGRESSPDLEWFRREIRKAYGGRPPRVLDPFAGGGAIPLEAMRLGCEATAIDINPVAWLILKCTLEYPHKLQGQKRPLPAFALNHPGFMAEYLKGQGFKGKELAAELERLGVGTAENGTLPGLLVGRVVVDAELAWHVRAWGWWILEAARADLQRFYPVIDGQPTVAYLWARTVTCKNCRATIPLLKTRWLCKKGDKRVLLTMKPDVDKTGVTFGVQRDVPHKGGSAAARREHDRRLGAGTMSHSGATCPCCSAIMTMEDIRLEGKAGRLGETMTTVVVDGLDGKEYRLPTPEELEAAAVAEREVERVFADVPFGLIDEPINTGSIRKGGVSITRWGITRWGEVFTRRQLAALGVFIQHTRAAREAMSHAGYSPEWIEASSCYLAAVLDRLADYSSRNCNWHKSGEKMGHTFQRFALPLIWDFAELNPLGDTTGGYMSALEWVSLAVSHLLEATSGMPEPTVLCQSALAPSIQDVDVVLTDPPYYDAIPYSDVMDFFYVWLRRTTLGFSPQVGVAFRDSLAPKWDRQKQDGELIEDESRFDGSRQLAKKAYEDGMARAFSTCHQALKHDGRLVIVFANKQADAWETLAGAIIRAGFIVDGSWPIQTEMGTRARALTSAALSSSVWLVCRKRPETARAGWDNQVLQEMREKITTRLREFWDAGVRGPDFVWAATGPALEAYSRHPVVKKANEPGKVMQVSEFLRTVRRMVVDFVVGRVLVGTGDGATAAGLDDATTYYLLHRHDFRLDDAPIGACILYAVSCGLSDAALVDRFDLLVRTGGKTGSDEDAGEDEREVTEEGDAEAEEGTGSKVKLKPWQQRTRRAMGYDADGRPAPLIDQVHRLMHLWKTGDVDQVNEYLDERALWRNPLFHQLLQALIELAAAGSDERSLLESLSNHVGARAVERDRRQAALPGI